MKKVFKIIAGLLGLLLLAVLIIPLLFNLNDYKDDIEELAREASGRELQIHGEIELSLFPWLGITVGEVALGNAPGFDGSFARIERAEVKLRLMPLLSQRLEAGTVIVRGLRLNLVVADDGTTNWGDLIAGEPTDVTSQHTSEPAVSPSPAIGLAALALGGLQIEDAEVNYVDRASDARYAARQLNLKTGPLALNTPLEVVFMSQFEASQPALQGRLELQTEIKMDVVNARYRFNATMLKATLNGAGLPAGQATVALLADIELDIQQQAVTLSAFELESYGLALSGAIGVNQFQSEPVFEGELRIAEFNPQTVLPALEIALPEMADTTALSRIQVSFALDGTRDQLNLQRLAIMFDESHIDGEVQWLMSDAPLPAMKYALVIDQVDVDRYLPPFDEAAAGGPGATPASAGAAAATLPLATLRALDIDGTLEIGKLKISGLQLSEIRADVNAAGGVMRMHPLRANLYQGEYRGDMQLDARGELPKISLNESLTKIQVGPLLKDYMGDDKVRGTGSVQAQLTAVGATQEAVTSSLNGTASIAFVDGAIKGFNIAQMMSEAKAKLKREPLPAVSAEIRDTDFAELTGSFQIKSGVVKNSDLSIKSPYLRIGGDGQVDLVSEAINYLATVVVSKTQKGQGGKALGDLRGLTLPVRVTGTFAEPKFRPELGDALKAQAREVLAKEKARLKAKLAKRKAEEKAAFEKKKAELKAALRQKSEAEKERLKQELEEKAKEKLKRLFGG